MKKLVSVALRSILVLVVGLVGIVVVTTTLNFVLTAVEKEGYKAPGTFVEVSGKKIHLVTMGSGPANVVLLSGFGTTVPMLDFLPLQRELGSKVRVTVVEYPGYGLSQDTDESPSTAQSVEEIRQALREAQILPPYTLVPHSISGLQALYYANKYPEELAGIVGLDISVPQQSAFLHPVKESLNAYEVLRILGVVRILFWIAPDLGGATTIGLSPQEISDYNMITNWMLGSHAIFSEGNQIVSHLQSQSSLRFPENLPVVLVLASTSAMRTGEGIPGLAWRAMHEEILGKNAQGKVVVLEGEHYIHHGNAEKIAELVWQVALR